MLRSCGLVEVVVGRSCWRWDYATMGVEERLLPRTARQRRWCPDGPAIPYLDPPSPSSLTLPTHNALHLPAVTLPYPPRTLLIPSPSALRATQSIKSSKHQSKSKQHTSNSQMRPAHWKIIRITPIVPGPVTHHLCGNSDDRIPGLVPPAARAEADVKPCAPAGKGAVGA